ncbi:AAA family ATPase [Acrocarpospora macrocephala]|uniref:nSTAND3 domain-containing NTPase n=1 Tax=Acrocarpospora macrocephala TaxID=150177 RepID=UPI0035A22B59
MSGAPGVGKTTLAKIVAAHYAALEYELVEISENVGGCLSDVERQLQSIIRL